MPDISALLLIRDPEILDGVRVVAGTWVPVRTFLDYFQRNRALDFLKELEHLVEDPALLA